MRLSCFLLLTVLAAGLCRQAIAQAERLTTASNVRMTINNLGIIGNSFRGSYNSLGYPSCEYPAGSGVEHLFDGGLWVGALVNGSRYVTSGALDNASGYAPGACNFEWTSPATGAPSNMRVISSLVRNPGYSPLAISHQDFQADFTDRNQFITGANGQPTNILVDRACPINESQHRPLGLDVHVETYNWNYSFANFFVVLDFTIKNVGTDTLKEVGLGYWADGVIRNVRKTAPGGTSFFDKGGNGYMDSLFMGYEFDATGDPGFTDSYIGIKYLGTDYRFTKNERDTTIFYHPARSVRYTGRDTGIKVFYNTWQFQSPLPLYFTPNSESERYLRLTTGLNYQPDWERVIRPAIREHSNRSNLVSIAPFARLAPGESFKIAFAVVLGRKTETGEPTTTDSEAQRSLLAANASWAQTTYNGEDVNFNGVLDPGEDANGNGILTRYSLPAPPETPLATVVATHNTATLYWADNAENSIDPITRKKDFAGYRIYKSKFAFDKADVTDLSATLELYKTYAFPSAELPFINPIPAKGEFHVEGDTTLYRYKLDITGLQDGWQHVIALTAYDSGNVVTNLPPLESAPLDNVFRVFPGSGASGDIKDNKPYVYPNPYYGSAAWERADARPEERKLVFANLPRRAKVRILTQAGDFVDEFEHQATGYTGQDSQWFKVNAAGGSQVVMPGGEHPWDLLSRSSQIIARGAYLYNVTDLDTKKEYVGKFVIIK